MPTKLRRQREDAREQESQLLDELLGLPLDLDRMDEKTKRVFHSADVADLASPYPNPGLMKIDEHGNVYLDETIGAGGNGKRHDDKMDRIEDLRNRYSSIWGKRGRAKKIALENNLSVRTVQRYFKET